MPPEVSLYSQTENTIGSRRAQRTRELQQGAYGKWRLTGCQNTAQIYLLPLHNAQATAYPLSLPTVRIPASSSLTHHAQPDKVAKCESPAGSPGSQLRRASPQHQNRQPNHRWRERVIPPVRVEAELARRSDTAGDGGAHERAWAGVGSELWIW